MRKTAGCGEEEGEKKNTKEMKGKKKERKIESNTSAHKGLKESNRFRFHYWTLSRASEFARAIA